MNDLLMHPRLEVRRTTHGDETPKPFLICCNIAPATANEHDGCPLQSEEVVAIVVIGVFEEDNRQDVIRKSEDRDAGISVDNQGRKFGLETRDASVENFQWYFCAIIHDQSGDIIEHFND